MNYYLAALKKYAVFQGRARREEFWMFMLFNIIFDFAFGIVCNILYLSLNIPPSPYLDYLYAVVVAMLTVAVFARRLHDTNRSAWWLLLGPVPIANITLLVFALMDSQPGANQYGPNPKEGSTVESAVGENANNQPAPKTVLRTTMMIVFTVIIGISIPPVAFMALMAVMFSDSPTIAPDVSALIACIFLYIPFAIAALAVCWIKKSALKGFLLLLLLVPIYGYEYYSSAATIAAQNAANANAIEQQQERAASLTKDFICNDGSFFHIEATNIDPRTLVYYATDTIPTGGYEVGYINAASDTLSVLDRTAENRKILMSCKDAQGRSPMDLYHGHDAAGTATSSFTPTIFPITSDEAISLVKNIAWVKKESQETPGGLLISSVGTFHDDLEDQDILMVKIEYPSSTGADPTYYSVFLNNGNILY
jgi:uncharacterized membrane protein YhaH (DUF805 family)